MCMYFHGVFKRYVGHNQKLNIFVWGMRSIVIVLNLFPIYLMNNVSDGFMEILESVAPPSYVRNLTLLLLCVLNRL